MADGTQISQALRVLEYSILQFPEISSKRKKKKKAENILIMSEISKSSFRGVDLNNKKTSEAKDLCGSSTRKI